jgi:hypothetical protein
MAATASVTAKRKWCCCKFMCSSLSSKGRLPQPRLVRKGARNHGRCLAGLSVAYSDPARPVLTVVSSSPRSLLDTVAKTLAHHRGFRPHQVLSTR